MKTELLHFKIWLEASTPQLVQDRVNPIAWTIIGSTFPIKDALPNLGFKFDWQMKQWRAYNLGHGEIEALHRLGVIVPSDHFDNLKPGDVKLIYKDGAYVLTGNTWPLKNEFKRLGFVWDKVVKKKWAVLKLNKRRIEGLESLGVVMPETPAQV